MGNSESRAASSSGSSSARPVRRSLPPQSSMDSSDMGGPGIRDERRSASMPNENDVAAAANRRHVPRPRRSRRPPSSSSSSSDDRLQRERGGIERGQQAAEETSSQLSYWYLIKHGYTELVHLIIRPPRTDYDQEDLGPDEFSFAGRVFVREDFVVVNDRRQKLVCSHWRPAPSSCAPSAQESMPCVVYLHGNSSCRLETLGVLRTCLAAGLTVAAFDTAGCGKSDGDYISLGYYERDDLKDVVAHLRAKRNVGAVALWGRSMGAATALLHADRDPSIAGIVVDSAFASLEQLVEEVVERGRQEGLTLPGFLVKIVLKFIRSSVKKRAHFDLRRLAPIDHAPVSFVPALFVAAEHDSFIAPHHSDQIFAAYGGDKNLVKVDGDHNSSRPQFLLDSAAIFLQTALQVEAVTTGKPSAFTDGLTAGGGRVPWEGALGRTSSLSMCSSPASSYRMTQDLDARYSGKTSLLVPMEPWSCPSCTFVNRPLSMQCEMCRNIYLPDDDEDEDDAEDAGDEEDDALASEAARRRALTTGGVRPPPAPTQSRSGASRRRTMEGVPSPSPSFVSSTSAQRPARSERSVGVVTVTTAPTSVSSRTSSP
ncbi:hypothetical protein PF005_g19662 [Phytophthora fragariae]|uniref:RanBP2-type domain-containing protein n=1 Tax=Phytophthora fragariae TaxID=53985 RepID=A0A6A3EEC1_9STRA|nr:hypothetical protein PF003_g3173 [Phytophthora fragariae]KAE8928468.1 hypothetical protein PF009_g21391 [Phytophthora fragariae]KAE8996201.1 hypothetical protein PF011_g16007 [Phytophthora fragariae]KAE9087335.1 hypothetical protein PF007_g20414 [Phytophthora fragariae]KAE9089796.1 hypothetical protein PF010_g18841 [Phytophthora fragariae]